MTNLSYHGVSLVISNGDLDPLLGIAMLFLES